MSLVPNKGLLTKIRAQAWWQLETKVPTAETSDNVLSITLRVPVPKGAAAHHNSEGGQKTELAFIYKVCDAFFPAGCVCMHLHTHINLSSHTTCLSRGHERISKPWPQLPSCGWYGSDTQAETLLHTDVTPEKNEWVRGALTGVLKATSCKGYQYGADHLKQEFSSSELHHDTWKHTMRS